MFKVTFTLNGYIVAVLFNRANSASEAIDLASMQIVDAYDDVRAEWLANAV